MAYAKLDLPMVGRARLRAAPWWTRRSSPRTAPGEYVQRWKTADGGVPERKDVVRLKHNEGTWHVTPKGENKTHIVYKFSVDPGGSIPDWLANLGQSDGVMDTLGAVEKRAQKLGKERKKAKPAAPKPRECRVGARSPRPGCGTPGQGAQNLRLRGCLPWGHREARFLKRDPACPA